MRNHNHERAPKRDVLSIAWEVLGLVVFVLLATALALAILGGRVTESVPIALLIMLQWIGTLRR